MLSDVIAAIDADFVSSGVRLSQSILIDNIATHMHGIPPRITCVATKDSYDGPHSIGGTVRAIRSRKCGSEAHIWGATVAATEALINQFILSMHRVTYGEYAVSAGEWNNETAFENFGFEYVLQFSANVPITDSPYQVVAGPFTVNNTGVMHFGGSDVAACGS